MIYTEIIEEQKLIELTESLPIDAEDIVFVSGSLVEGIGNKYSDIDVFVLTNNLSSPEISSFAEYDDGYRKTGFTRRANINFDVEFWDLNYINKVVERINNIDFSNPGIRVWNLLKSAGMPPENALSFLHRFYVGRPIRNEEIFNQLRERINFTNYFILKKLSIKVSLDNIYDDVLGNISEKDYFNGLVLLREMLLMSMGLMLLSKKISFDRTKWIYPLFKREFSVSEKEIFDKYLWQEVTEENVALLVKSGINYINKILEEINYE